MSEGIFQTEDSPDERLVRQEQRELIRRTMEILPQKDRGIARGFYLEGASYNELTSTHELSYNAVAFRFFRIKRRLRYLLTGVLIPPRLVLKKLYTGGLTWNYPKMMVGGIGLIALIFIGFVAIR